MVAFLALQLCSICCRVTDSERERLLVRKVTEEKKMREEGRLSDMATILKVLPEVSDRNPQSTGRP